MKNIFKKISNDDMVSSKSNVRLEYLKHSGYGKTYGIIKEHNNYVVKETAKQSNFFYEDFSDVESTNKYRFKKKTLQEAIKMLEMYINETKYVLNLPKPKTVEPTPNPQPVQPELPSPEKTSQDASEMEDAQTPSTEPTEQSDNTDDILSMVGKLTAELRDLISNGQEETTVGQFKSVLAAAKGLSPENKQEVLDKAEEVLNTENTDTNNTAENQQNDENIDNLNIEESVDIEDETTSIKKLLFDMQNSGNIKGYRILGESDSDYSFLVETGEGRFCVKCKKSDEGKTISLWETEKNSPTNLKTQKNINNAPYHTMIGEFLNKK